MKIKELISQSRNDFSAILTCEHCNAEELLTTGYDDEYYHAEVLPSFHCESCGKDRNGEVAPRQPA